MLFKKNNIFSKISMKPTNHYKPTPIYQNLNIYIYICVCHIAYCIHGWPWGLWESLTHGWPWGLWEWLTWNIISKWPDGLWSALACHGNGINGHEAFAASICYMECNDLPLPHFFLAMICCCSDGSLAHLLGPLPRTMANLTIVNHWVGNV